MLISVCWAGVILSDASFWPCIYKVHLGNGTTDYFLVLTCFERYASQRNVQENNACARHELLCIKDSKSCNGSLHCRILTNISHVVTFRLQRWLCPQLYSKEKIVVELLVSSSRNDKVNSNVTEGTQYEKKLKIYRSRHAILSSMSLCRKAERIVLQYMREITGSQESYVAVIYVYRGTIRRCFQSWNDSSVECTALRSV